ADPGRIRTQDPAASEPAARPTDVCVACSRDRPAASRVRAAPTATPDSPWPHRHKSQYVRKHILSPRGQSNEAVSHRECDPGYRDRTDTPSHRSSQPVAATYRCVPGRRSVVAFHTDNSSPIPPQKARENYPPSNIAIFFVYWLP